MHLPVLLCGFVCGYQYGLLVGFIAPLFGDYGRTRFPGGNRGSEPLQKADEGAE